MAHTVRDKKKLIARLRRLQGQLKSAEASLDDEMDCYQVLQTLASARGALSGLMGDIVEGHIREHVVQAHNSKEASAAGEETIEILKSFWK